ncbi:MAG: hypothetical protein IJ534_07510 [Bacteroidaceae bacterium]|nr:hypothetical protein [Bacteroidaceae bacterium]
MKYMSFLAGAFGLMALAACSSEDAVIVEQPKVLHTITVAYGGADTRFQTEEYFENGLPALKGSWEAGDQIKLTDENGKEYIYTAKESGYSATFALEGTEVPADGKYSILFPADWNGTADNFAVQDVSDASYWFISKAKEYSYATGTATCSGGSFGETAKVTPIFNFVYIKPDSFIKNMHAIYPISEDDEGHIIPSWTNGMAEVTLGGKNLCNAINGFDEEGKLVGSPMDEFGSGYIVLNNFNLKVLKKDYYDTGNPFNGYYTSGSIFFAFPVINEPVRLSGIAFGGKGAQILKKEGGRLEATEGGHFLHNF